MRTRELIELNKVPILLKRKFVFGRLPNNPRISSEEIEITYLINSDYLIMEVGKHI